MRPSEVKVYRQRMSVEAVLSQPIPLPESLASFMGALAEVLKMTVVGIPSTLKVELPNNQGRGVHLHLNWTESGADLYTWEKFQLLTLDVYACKPFKEAAVTKLFLGAFPVAAYRTGRTVWDAERVIERDAP